MTGNYKLAKQAGWVAIVGGSFQIVYGLLAIVYNFGSGEYYGWDEALWIVATVGMAGAVLGILALDAGTPGWLTQLSGIAVIIGVGCRIVASIFLIIQSAWDPLPLILLSIFLIIGGMLLLGITVLRGDEITGWKAWTPLLVAIFGFIVAALYDASLYVHHILLGFWGATWMLVGYVAISYGSTAVSRLSYRPL